jgi:hypothetical protein
MELNDDKAAKTEAQRTAAGMISNSAPTLWAGTGISIVVSDADWRELFSLHVSSS